MTGEGVSTTTSDMAATEAASTEQRVGRRAKSGAARNVGVTPSVGLDEPRHCVYGFVPGFSRVVKLS